MRAVRAAAAARRQGRNWAAGGGGMPKQKSKVGFSSCNASRNMSLPAHLNTNNIHSGSILDQGKSNGCKFMNPIGT